MSNWRYKLETDFSFFSHHLAGVDLVNEWCEIKNNIINVEPGYAWDGVTPAYPIIKSGPPSYGLWFGVWDGPRYTNGLPVTWRATLIHDVLCQFREDIKHSITKEQTVNIFKDKLRIDGAPKIIQEVYPWFVDKFGPQDWKK